MKTLVIAPSIRRLGGITTVVLSHRDSHIWNEWGCLWIGTSPSLSVFWKGIWVIGALLRYAWHLPGAKLVHIHVSDGASVPRKKLFFYPANWMGKKVVLHFHAPSIMLHEERQRFHQLRAMFEKADKVVALSRSWALQIKKNIPLANVSVVANAVARPDSVLGIPQRRKVIFYSGKLEKRKGYNHLLEAFAKLSKAYPEWTLELAGDGEIECATKIAQTLGVLDRVKVLGWVKRDQMLELLGDSRIFCLPSFAEGFPMSVLEALAYGCAVVTTPVGGLKDDLVDGEDVVFTQPGDSESLAFALRRVIESAELQETLSHRGRLLSQTRYSKHASIEEMERIYKEVAG